MVQFPRVQVDKKLFSILKGETMQHMPIRDDDVALWLKRWRDQYPQQTDAWHYIDDMLDDYRLHADTGKPLFFVIPTTEEPTNEEE